MKNDEICTVKHETGKSQAEPIAPLPRKGHSEYPKLPTPSLRDERPKPQGAAKAPLTFNAPKKFKHNNHHHSKTKRRKQSFQHGVAVEHLFPKPEPRKPRLNTRLLRPPATHLRKRKDTYNERDWEKRSKRQKVVYTGSKIPFLEYKSPAQSEEEIEEGMCRVLPGRSLWTPRTLAHYKKQDKVGAGVYGDVYKAVSPNGEVVALKHLRIENETEGLPLTVLREVHVLGKLDHENIIRLYDVVTSEEDGPMSRRRAEIYMVLEWCDHDLAGLIKQPSFAFSETTIKHFMVGILNGCIHLHLTHNILHRDLKPANILITKNRVVKLADFGLSRIFKKDKNLTNENKVVTRFYRAPELLLQEMRYNHAIDVWSIGCIFAEMMQREPIFQARLDMHQLAVIEDTCGSITEETWPGVQELGFNVTSRLLRQRKVKDRFAVYIKDWNDSNKTKGLELLDKLLQLDPKKRIGVKQALEHRYFQCKPTAVPPELPSKYSFEYGTRKRRRTRKGQGHNQGQRNRNPGYDIAQKFSDRFKPKKHRPYRGQVPYQQFRPNLQRHQMGGYQHLPLQPGFQVTHRPDREGWRNQQLSRNSRNFPHPHRQQPQNNRHRNRPS